ncbi:MAG TPA: hypothetical protein VN957_10215 [Chthoniobacterales bacterium]|jgi:hypothetical protein|nr:hypothetical protein [Chthoniobacterales bacterium]
MTDKRSASADEDSAGQPLESANGGRSISGFSAALLPQIQEGWLAVKGTKFFNAKLRQDPAPTRRIQAR